VIEGESNHLYTSNKEIYARKEMGYRGANLNESWEGATSRWTRSK